MKGEESSGRSLDEGAEDKTKLNNSILAINSNILQYEDDPLLAI